MRAAVMLAIRLVTIGCAHADVKPGFCRAF
jgi:hypothetical protein